MAWIDVARHGTSRLWALGTGTGARIGTEVDGASQTVELTRSECHILASVLLNPNDLPLVNRLAKTVAGDRDVTEDDRAVVRSMLHALDPE